MFRNNELKIFVFAILVKSYIFYLALDFLGGDEFYYISRGLLLAKGLIPYSEFSYVHPPGMIIITAIPQFFLGNSYLALRLISLIVDSLNACLIFSITKQIYKKRVAWIASILYILNIVSLKTAATTMSETYMVFFILSGFYFLLVKPGKYLGSLLLAFCFMIKFWSVIFWLPPVIFMLFRGQIKFIKIGNMFVFMLIMSAPLLFVFDDFVVNQGYYKNVHGSLVFKDPHEKIINVLKIILKYQPLMLISLLGVFFNYGFLRKINFIHIWFLTTFSFAFFPSFFPEHHMLMTLPAISIIFGKYISDLSRKIKKDFTVVIIITLLSGYMVFSENNVYFSYFGFKNYEKEKIAKVSEYIKLHSSQKDLIMQDYAFYSYISGIEDNTRFGFHYGHNMFSPDDLNEIIKNTKPRYLAITFKNGYPIATQLFIASNYTRVNLGYRGYPTLYETGYNQSENSVADSWNKLLG